MLPAVEKVIRQGGIWTVEIVGLRRTISAQLWQVADSNPDVVKIITLNPYDFCLTEEETFEYDDDAEEEEALYVNDAVSEDAWGYPEWEKRELPEHSDY
jgi:hypothetical protein